MSGLIKILRQYRLFFKKVKDLEEFTIQQIKQHYLALLPKEITLEEWMSGNSEYSGRDAEMYNQAIAEIRKKIQEGK